MCSGNGPIFAAMYKPSAPRSSLRRPAQLSTCVDDGDEDRRTVHSINHGGCSREISADLEFVGAELVSIISWRATIIDGSYLIARIRDSQQKRQSYQRRRWVCGCSWLLTGWSLRNHSRETCVRGSDDAAEIAEKGDNEN